MLAEQVERVYLDLADQPFDSALAPDHQRYSTNPFPTWDLALEVHKGGLGGTGLRSGRPRIPAGRDRVEGPAPPGADVPRRHDPRPHHRRQRTEERPGRPETVSPVAQRKPNQARRLAEGE